MCLLTLLALLAPFGGDDSSVEGSMQVVSRGYFLVFQTRH